MDIYVLVPQGSTVVVGVAVAPTPDRGKGVCERNIEDLPCFNALPPPTLGNTRFKERRGGERVKTLEDISEGLDSVYESKLNPRVQLSVDQKPASPTHTHSQTPVCAS